MSIHLFLDFSVVRILAVFDFRRRNTASGLRSVFWTAFHDGTISNSDAHTQGKWKEAVLLEFIEIEERGKGRGIPFPRHSRG